MGNDRYFWTALLIHIHFVIYHPTLCDLSSWYFDLKLHVRPPIFFQSYSTVTPHGIMKLVIDSLVEEGLIHLLITN
jgi:hypothetical protein